MNSTADYSKELRRRFTGKTWAEVQWELEEEEEEEQRVINERIKERNRVNDAARKQLYNLKKYEAEEGEIFE
jgi:hypothetical protein